ncbi:NAD-dependent epimerase [Aneurinibacillus aneurinilyticus]|uniref:NAD-dependent epimerase n=1 Tax=Aneurinibacillus aneurinilyticus TaxID=1391 RepID=A0A848CNN2_ANEAE|nr:NAD-dependent epimerase [Aneurinibacillus aneurinilyticus]NME97453.1 NAD-dependent epimerase [Aneurinibacillus aneurinilyticus]
MSYNTHILVTGCAGFIGFHVACRLLDEGYAVTGLDNLNNYYDVSLKRARLALLRERYGFTFVHAALEDKEAIEATFASNDYATVIHLAAQAGVRYSLQNPHAYVDSNLTGFVNILEACRTFGAGHLVYASSSSVYGSNRKQPFSEHDVTDQPVSLYAATKKANELLAHTYSHLYGLPTTGIRFFTVYGPWGRPDMAYFSFTRAILSGEPIRLFNEGKMKRDFTYIDDAVEAVIRLMHLIPKSQSKREPMWDDSIANQPPYRIYNVGSHRPVPLLTFVETLEQALERKAIKEWLPMQLGDVKDTYADIGQLMRDTGYCPETSLKKGLEAFVAWYRTIYI